MTATEGNLVVLPRSRRPAVESEVLGMLILVLTEVMFFAGLLSAYNIVGARSAAGIWPPPTDPPLPVDATIAPTAALLLSGGLVYWAGRRFSKGVQSPLGPVAVAGLLAAWFVVAQVVEFAGMVGKGLTLSSSAHGGFFYLIVGAHALHAVVALLVLGWAGWRLQAGKMSAALFAAVRVYWYFVVGLWPFLYWVVYL
jgi:cytochrome c oxidase subunit 3